ncbi:MAG: hypothetical protein ACRDBO_02680, partial [Lachnospiraceae bacterium]
MSTSKELRQSFANKYDEIIGRNIYDQNLRNYVLTPYNGKYYSDCSSSICAVLNAIGATTSLLNTAGMYKATSLFENVKVTITNGHIPDSEFSKLRQGDALMYVGNDPSRPLQIGHVEAIHTLGSNEATTQICGHGSNTPSYKNMKTYNTTRQASTAGNGKAKGLVAVLRRIKDDGSELSVSESYEIGTSNSGLTTTADLNYRQSPINGVVKGTYAKGTIVYPTAKCFADGAPWYKTDKGWISGKYLEGWIHELSDYAQRWWYVQPGYTYPVSEWMEYNGTWFYI